MARRRQRKISQRALHNSGVEIPREFKEMGLTQRRVRSLLHGIPFSVLSYDPRKVVMKVESYSLPGISQLEVLGVCIDPYFGRTDEGVVLPSDNPEGGITDILEGTFAYRARDKSHVVLLNIKPSSPRE